LLSEILGVQRVGQSGSNLGLLGKVFPLQSTSNLGKNIEILNKTFNFEGLSAINHPGMILAEFVLLYIILIQTQ
jgi:hypothetical protein